MGEGAKAALAARKKRASAPGITVQNDKGEKQFQVMRHRLRDRLAFWTKITASTLILGWIATGFPLKWTIDSPPPAFSAPNHASIRGHEAWVSTQISELVQCGSVQPWPTKPHIVSPLGLVPKKGSSDKFRLIWDGRYVNEHLSIPSFKYEDLSHIHEFVQPEDYLITLDLSKGYHHVDMAEDSYQFLGFEWNGQYYVFTSLPFGLASAPWAFSKIIDVFVSRWRHLGHRCSGYLDDSIHAGQRKHELELFVSTHVLPDLENAGFIVNTVKSHLHASQVERYLGMLIDTVQGKMFIPPDKLARLEQ